MQIAVLTTFVMTALLRTNVISFILPHNEEQEHAQESGTANIKTDLSKWNSTDSQMESNFNERKPSSRNKMLYRRRRSEPLVNFDGSHSIKVNDKRYSAFRSDLGKRLDDSLDFSNGYSDDEDKRAGSFRGDLGKRLLPLLGKRKASAFRSDLGKRAFSQFRSDLGKRNGHEYLLPGNEEQYNENDDLVMF